MALQLTLDYALQIVGEPGYWARYSSRDWEKRLNPAGTNSNRHFWSDQATRALMLMPQQLLKGFLNSSAQLDSIIGLTDRGSGKLVTHPTNISAFTLFEANLKQNENNPWVFFAPIPGETGSIVQLLGQLALIALDAQTGWPVDTTDSRVIAYTEEALIGNQALYLRWYQPDTQAGSVSIMGFTIGEFVLVFSGDQLQVLEDISPAKDRSDFRHLMYAPLFAAGVTPTANNAPSNRATVDEAGPGERAILWLPFRRSLVYVEAYPGGQWCILDTRTTPRLNGGAAETLDWDIVEDRNLLVWGISPSVGRFQVQKVKWSGPQGREARLPHFVIDYTPANPLTSGNIHLDGDANRGTSLTSGDPTTPPGYDNFINRLNDCPPPTTDATAQSRTYGLTVTFQTDANQRFTPFLYGLDVRLPRQVDTWAVPATLIDDSGLGEGRIAAATLASSLDPGDSRLDMDLWDFPAYALDDLYFRSAFPVRLVDTGPDPDALLFTGIALPPITEPLHLNAPRPRGLRLEASDLWSRLANSPLRDQRDWTGVGHITVVDFVVQQMGIDTTGADYPAPLAAWNQPLGGIDPAMAQEGLKPHWQPDDNDTAGSFLLRIAQQFAGFKIGFYPSGQFFYLPAEPVWFYNTSEVTFYPSAAAAPSNTAPRYRSPLSYEAVEPEANVVQVECQAKDGGRLRSSLFVDWASILNPAAVNFLGYWKAKTYEFGGVLSCAELNRVARVAWNADRRRHLIVRFSADYVPSLRVGRVFTLAGIADTWRLLNYQARYVHDGWTPAQVEAELVEPGYGVA